MYCREFFLMMACKMLAADLEINKSGRQEPAFGAKWKHHLRTVLLD